MKIETTKDLDKLRELGDKLEVIKREKEAYENALARLKVDCIEIQELHGYPNTLENEDQLLIEELITLLGLE